MKLGDKIRTIRKSKGLTQFELSAKSGVHEVTISGLETNRTITPQIDTIARLASGLGVSLDMLLEGVDFDGD